MPTIKSIFRYMPIFLLSFVTLIQAQLQSNVQTPEIKIEKIIDTNLFLLNDGRKIRLANLLMPSLNDSNPIKRTIARDILSFEKKSLRNHKLELIISPTTTMQDSIIAVHLFNKSILNHVNFNKYFLEKGYARYVPEDTLFKQEYLLAEQKARSKQKVIWRPDAYLESKTALFLAGLMSSLGQFHLKENSANDRALMYGANILVTAANDWINGEIKISRLWIQEKGYGGCEMVPPYHYKSNLLYNIYFLNTRINHKFYGFGLGLFFLDQIKIGHCSEERYSMFVKPIFNLRVGYLPKMYLEAQFMDVPVRLWKWHLFYRLHSSLTNLWLGFHTLSLDESFHYQGYFKSIHYLSFGFQYFLLNRILLRIGSLASSNWRDKFVKCALLIKLH